VLDPDPKSRTGAVRIIGYSASAGFVITIIAIGGARDGVTAWKSSRPIQCDYARGVEHALMWAQYATAAPPVPLQDAHDRRERMNWQMPG
jgi:hypothetical protein